MSDEEPDLESRWRDWQRDGAAAPAPDSVRAERLRPPAVRTAAAVVVLLALAALAVAVLARSGGDDRPPPPVGGAGPTAGETSTASAAERDLTSLATATASGNAVSGVDAGGAIVSYLPSDVLDLDPLTSWRTDGPGDGQTLTLAFSREVTVTRVGLAVGAPASDATGDSAATRHGRDVQQVTWVVGDSTVTQPLDPARLDLQELRLPRPVPTRTLTLRVDRTVPGPVASDDFTAVTQVVVYGAPTSG